MIRRVVAVVVAVAVSVAAAVVVVLVVVASSSMLVIVEVVAVLIMTSAYVVETLVVGEKLIKVGKGVLDIRVTFSFWRQINQLRGNQGVARVKI